MLRPKQQVHLDNMYCLRQKTLHQLDAWDIYLFKKSLNVQLADLYNSTLKICPFESDPRRVIGN